VDDVVDVNYSIAIYKLKPCNSAIELTILMMPAMIVGRAFMITEKFMIGCLNKLKKSSK
jgi:hypothetical protein